MWTLTGNKFRALGSTATDQHFQERAGHRRSTNRPCLFVSWKTVTEQVGIPAVQAVVAQLARWSFACSQPSPRTPTARVPCGLHGMQSIPTLAESVEPSTINPGRSRKKCQPEPFMGTSPQAHADHHAFWLTTATVPPLIVYRFIGGLGGGALGGSDASTFDCTNPRVDGTCVYGPSLAPVDQPGEKVTGVAAGATTCPHELAMLISLLCSHACDGKSLVLGGRQSSIGEPKSC